MFRGRIWFRYILDIYICYLWYLIISIFIYIVFCVILIMTQLAAYYYLLFYHEPIVIDFIESGI